MPETDDPPGVKRLRLRVVATVLVATTVGAGLAIVLQHFGLQKSVAFAVAIWVGCLSAIRPTVALLRAEGRAVSWRRLALTFTLIAILMAALPFLFRY